MAIALLTTPASLLIMVAIIGLAGWLGWKLHRLLKRLIGWMYDMIRFQRQAVSSIRDYERLAKQRDVWQYRQIESLLELNSLLGFHVTGLRHWAISPDAAVLLYKAIKDSKPRIVLELGGGISSVVIAQALKTNGQGRLISIDHQPAYAATTRRYLEQAGLTSLAEVRVAKLKSYKSRGRWYDPKVVKQGLKRIDFIVVDGPPEATGKMARQPAISVLMDIIAQSVQIFMDDYNRPDEQAAAASWLKLLPGHSLEAYQTEKGTALIRPRPVTGRNRT